MCLCLLPIVKALRGWGVAAAVIGLALVGCTAPAPPSEGHVENGAAGELSAAYAGGSAIGTIGELATPLPHVFSKVRDVLVWTDTTVLVIDGDANEVRRFRATGEYAGKIGRAGDGPGEFRAAWALVPINDTALAVLDRFLRMAVFTTDADGALAYERTIAMPLSASGVCAWGGHFLAYGVQPGGLLHEIDGAGEMVRSFGAPFGEGSPLRREQMSNGSLFCDYPAGRVFAVSYARGAVRAYRVASGHLEWEGGVQGFAPISITEREDGSVVNQSPLEGFDVVSGAWVEEDGDLIVQVVRRPHPTRADAQPRPVRTFRLDGESGHLQEVSSRLAQVEAAGRGIVVLRDRSVDYPRFEVARMPRTVRPVP